MIETNGSVPMVMVYVVNCKTNILILHIKLSQLNLI